MTQHITFIAHGLSPIVVEHKDVFTLTPERGHVWLQKLALWLLRTLRCNWYEKTTTVTQFTFEEHDFARNLYRQRDDLFDFFGRTGSQLLIGGEDFRALMDSPEVTRDFTFYVELARDRRVFNLSVRVIPWMKGMVVV